MLGKPKAKLDGPQISATVLPGKIAQTVQPCKRLKQQKNKRKSHGDIGYWTPCEM